MSIRDEAIETAASEWPLGSSVRKSRGSQWHGRVVGYYSTDLTPRGVCIESAYEVGSVQIYPCAAIEAWNPKAEREGE